MTEEAASAEVVPRRAQRSITMYRVGGREFPLVSNSQCKVCCSPHRMEIEREVISGHGYSGIAKRWSEDWEVTSRNVRDHYQAHMPATLAAAREIVDRRARAMGLNIEAANEVLVDHISFAETVVHKAFERIASGDVVPTVKEGIAAARLLAAVEGTSEGIDHEVMAEAFAVYMESAQAEMTPVQWERFGRRITSSPVLKALKERVEERERERQAAIAGGDDD